MNWGAAITLSKKDIVGIGHREKTQVSTENLQILNK